MYSGKINFGIVGYGRIGRRHAEEISKNPHCRLVAVVDVKSKDETDLKTSGISYFNDIESLLHAPQRPNVVSIATPNGLHFEQTKFLLQNGFHVIAEKPMAFRPEEVSELIALADQNGVQLFPVMQNRFSPPSVWLKQLVADGRLGDIFMVQLNCFWNRDSRYYTPDSWHGSMDLDGGTLYTQFSHFIDIMYWIFGDIQNISGWLANFSHKSSIGFEDSGNVFFDFVHGGKGALNFSTSVFGKNMESSVTVIGEKGSVKIGGQYMDRVEFCSVEDYQFSEFTQQVLPNNYGGFQGSAANHHFVISNVVDVLLGGGTPAVAPAESRDVISIISRIYAALRDK